MVAVRASFLTMHARMPCIQVNLDDENSRVVHAQEQNLVAALRRTPPAAGSAAAGSSGGGAGGAGRGRGFNKTNIAQRNQAQPQPAPAPAPVPGVTRVAHGGGGGRRAVTVRRTTATMPVAGRQYVSRQVADAEFEVDPAWAVPVRPFFEMNSIFQTTFQLWTFPLMVAIAGKQQPQLTESAELAA
eukprot:SAG22_NODE_138_length_18031_cov_5.796621_21_plen_186_part_00